MRPQPNAQAGARPPLLARVDLDDVALDELACRVASILQAAEPAESASPYLTTSEAATYLRASRQRVFDLVHGGQLEPHRDGRRLLFHRDAIDEYLAGEKGDER